MLFCPDRAPWERQMRIFRRRREFIAALIVASALAADAGHAQESFFNERYCTRSTGGDLSGPMDCSLLGSNASRARVAWAASAWKTRSGAGLGRSRRRRARVHARVHAAFVKSPPLSKALPTCRQPGGGAQVCAYRDRPLLVPQARNSLAGRADIGHDPLNYATRRYGRR